MTDKIDIAFLLDEDNVYDVTIGPDGDLLATDGFETSLIMSFATDARAAASEIQNPYSRRGFIGDEFFDDFNHGSKLWLLDQSRLTSSIRNSAVNYSRQCLQWTIDDGYARDVSVSGSLRPNTILLNMRITSVSSNIDSWSYDLWQNTLLESGLIREFRKDESLDSQVDRLENAVNSYIAAAARVLNRWAIG